METYILLPCRDIDRILVCISKREKNYHILLALALTFFSPADPPVVLYACMLICVNR